MSSELLAPRASWLRSAPPRLLLALLIATWTTGCDERPPPCHSDGDGIGTIAAPTPTPPWGGNGPGSPPDHGDAPDEYSKNAEGEVCLCGPYEIGCTTDPDGTPGDEFGQESPSAPSGCNATPDTYVDCGAACRAQCGERMAIGNFSPSIFKFVTTLADDGTDKGGGWREASVRLEFERWDDLLPRLWECPITVGMPLRTKARGTVSPEFAATVSAEIAKDASQILMHGPTELPPGIFCSRLGPQMQGLFWDRYDWLGATVK
jgi:hypothetical protein